ncbi:DnaJ domain-containing protein [Terrimonas pollutisoli]|uniref:DnaJ domain-containing protein n=1 Tax=Terrimonas pollutisoli TaxID=3034147 RepID=UPI0023EE1A5D|nr:J domain-containing protein [Terrimonas sp. H1YJ31]
MQLKDYYSILELEPSATGEEIKKAYRRLAHTYHPDKKQDDLYATAKFGEIKEAYEVLSNPLKKDYYLQQRWYAQSMGKKIKQELVTPVSILKQLLELDRYVSKLDAHRMYHRGLYDHLITILSDENITLINSFNDPAINKEIILSTFKSSRPLPYQYIQLLSERLTKLTTNDTQITARIEQFKRQHKQTDTWEKRKVWFMLFIVLCLCLIIFLSSR